jgi:hypothetical protein
MVHGKPDAHGAALRSEADLPVQITRSMVSARASNLREEY